MKFYKQSSECHGEEMDKRVFMEYCFANSAKGSEYENEVCALNTALGGISEWYVRRPYSHCQPEM
jgi:hypothetical protein